MLLTQIWSEKLYILRAIAHTVLSDSSVVEDVLQETFVKVLEKRRTFEDQNEAFNYLRRAVINNSIDAFRKRQRHLRRFGHRGNTQNSLEFIDGDPSSPLDFLIREENIREKNHLVQEVHNALRHLPSPQKEAIYLFFNRSSNQNIKDLCRKKGVPYSTVRSRMLRGIDNIRKQLRTRRVPGFEDGRIRGH